MNSKPLEDNEIPPFERDPWFEVWWLILQTRRIMCRVREKELARYGTNGEELVILFVVHATGEKATPSEISRWIVRTPHTVSGLLSKMEQKGLIRKFKDLDKKNLVRISMTDKGKSLYLQATKGQLIKRIMSCLSEEQCSVMTENLLKLRNRAYQEDPASQKPPFP